MSPKYPLTNLQISDLRELGIEFDQNTLGFDEARQILYTVRRTTPAFGWRLQKLQSWGLSDELPPNATMEDLVHFFNEVKYETPTRLQIEEVRKRGIQIRPSGMTAIGLDEFMNLQRLPPQASDLEILRGWHVSHTFNDGFAVKSLATLVGFFVDLAGLALKNYESYASDFEKIAKARLVIPSASYIALEDPVYKTPVIRVSVHWESFFSWPREKIKEWYRKGRAY